MSNNKSFRAVFAYLVGMLLVISVVVIVLREKFSTDSAYAEIAQKAEENFSIFSKCDLVRISQGLVDVDLAVYSAKELERARINSNSNFGGYIWQLDLRKWRLHRHLLGEYDRSSEVTPYTGVGIREFCEAEASGMGSPDFDTRIMRLRNKVFYISHSVVNYYRLDENISDWSYKSGRHFGFEVSIDYQQLTSPKIDLIESCEAVVDSTTALQQLSLLRKLLACDVSGAISDIKAFGELAADDYLLLGELYAMDSDLGTRDNTESLKRMVGAALVGDSDIQYAAAVRVAQFMPKLSAELLQLSASSGNRFASMSLANYYAEQGAWEELYFWALNSKYLCFLDSVECPSKFPTKFFGPSNRVNKLIELDQSHIVSYSISDAQEKLEFTDALRIERAAREWQAKRLEEIEQQKKSIAKQVQGHVSI